MRRKSTWLILVLLAFFVFIGFSDSKKNIVICPQQYEQLLSRNMSFYDKREVLFESNLIALLMAFGGQDIVPITHYRRRHITLEHDRRGVSLKKPLSISGPFIIDADLDLDSIVVAIGHNEVWRFCLVKDCKVKGYDDHTMIVVPDYESMKSKEQLIEMIP